MSLDSTTTPLEVLLVEDEDTTREVLNQLLTEDGFRIVQAASAEEALSSFQRHPVPLIVADIVLGKMSGTDLLQEIRRIAPDTVAIVITSHASVRSAQAALRAGAYDFLVKPFDDLSVVSGVVGRAADKYRLERRNEELVTELRQRSSELQQLNAKLEKMATHDAMTGLHNRGHFRTLLENEIVRCRRHDRICSLLFIDIDHFKRLNDRHGHLAGDDLLQQMGELLLERCRLSDVVGRYGGEEFVVLLPETGLEGATACAESIRARVEGELRGPDGGEPVTVSIGVASYPQAGDRTDDLLDLADRALYRAKNDGRNRVVVLEPEGEAVPARS